MIPARRMNAALPAAGKKIHQIPRSDFKFTRVREAH